MPETKAVRAIDLNATVQQIERCFTYHAPKPQQVDRFYELRKRAKELATVYAELCPPGRETSLALTHLEQSVMWANAAIAREGK